MVVRKWICAGLVLSGIGASLAALTPLLPCKGREEETCVCS